MATLGIDSGEIHKVAHLVNRRGHVVLAGRFGPVTLLSGGVSSGPPPRRRPEIGVYEFLTEQGIISLGGDIRAGPLPLSGGSVSRCTLELGEPSLVRKSVTTLNTLPPMDAYQRHFREAKWLMTIQADVDLFPYTEMSVNASSADLEITSEWIPAYTLGEWLLQAPRTAGVIAERLKCVLDRLESELYWRPAPTSYNTAESYADKIRRRRRFLTQDPLVGDVAGALFRFGGVINDNPCRSIDSLLHAFETRTSLESKLSGWTCHGDLIPEDILADGHGNMLALIDPNPQISTPLCDYAKLVMSFAVTYDLALRDLVAVDVEPKISQVREPVRIATEVSPEWRSVSTVHRHVAEELAEWAPSSQWCRGHATGVSPSWFLAMAGMQAIAISAFHLVHHGNPDRAVYFLAEGLRLLDRGMHGLETTHVA